MKGTTETTVLLCTSKVTYPIPEIGAHAKQSAADAGGWWPKKEIGFCATWVTLTVPHAPFLASRNLSVLLNQITSEQDWEELAERSPGQITLSHVT